ncbi:MAG: hypothetical protein ACT4P7_07240, partial [Gemmatimonadaceae bacterium]
RLTTRAAGPVRIAIFDVKGDTVRTLTGPATPGLHRVTWGFQGPTPARRPLSLAQRRDSTQQMQRIAFVLDSIEKSGTNAEAIGRLRSAITSGRLGQAAPGGGGGGGGGGAPVGAQAGMFVARPGEATQQGGGGGGGGGAGGAAVTAVRQALGSGPGQSEAGSGDQALAQQLVALFDIPGRPTGGGGGFGAPTFLTRLGIAGGGGFGGGGFGGGGGNTVGEGEYLVTVTVGGKTMKQVLRVGRGTSAAVLQ